jgi:oligopeptide/dipeptide ABC transporter ATP-binding protein
VPLPASGEPVLAVRDLAVEFATWGGVVQAVRGISFDVHAGRTLAIVGESGCGKTVAVQAVTGLIPMPPGRITAGSVRLSNREILGRWDAERVRGTGIGMIFQDPMTSLNPTRRIGDQVAETLVVHRGERRASAWRRAVELLELVRIPDAAERARQYPHQFSGGMLQRAMIAGAIACNPSVLIADEPTTALDVTIQAQILDLLLSLQQREGMAIVLITHDLGVVARMADDVAVMYAGEIVEQGLVTDVFAACGHPYTLGLRRALPSRAAGRDAQLVPIDGTPPDLFAPPPGCAYYARCPQAMRACETGHPPLAETGVAGQQARCWLQHAGAPRVADLVQQAPAASPP